MPKPLSQPGGGPAQGFLVVQQWATAQLGGELARVRLAVAQEPTAAQIPDLMRLNPFELRVEDIVFTVTGPQLAISTENKGEVSVSYQASGFVVNEAGEIVSLIQQASGQVTAKAPVVKSRIASQSSCAGVVAPVTAYVQLTITQQAGAQSAQRTEIITFKKEKE